MEKLKMTPSEALVETLVAEGIENVFGIVGSAYMDALDLFPAANIRFVPVAHEQAACHAADGFARVTGKPQVCIAQNGPGAANFVSAMTAAFWAHSPVVAITPETGSLGLGTGGFQELDQMAMFEKSTVYQVRVPNGSRMAELARRCFYMAKNLNGPTQLNIPRDHFYGMCEDEIYTTPVVSRGPGGVADIENAAKLIKEARYPVIVSGGGVSQADAIEEVKALAQYLTAPVVNTYLHNDTFPASHELACGPIGYCGSKAGMRILKKADLIIALGTRLGPFGTLAQYDIDYWPENAKLIQCDTDINVLGLAKKADVYSVGNVKEFAAYLLKEVQTAVPGLTKNEAVLNDVKAEIKKWDDEMKDWNSSNRSAPMHPRRFHAEWTKVLPKDTIVATDIGNNSSMINGYLKFEGIRQHISALSWGNCGFAYGAAMGCKVAKPDVPVIAFQGDGAYGISGVQEVMTAVRENIPVIAIVATNYEWGAEKKNQIDFYGNRFVGANLPDNPDYAKLAEDMGAKGIKIDHPDQVGDAVRQAIASGKPCVINAIVQGGEEVLAEPFRRDALNMPVRYLEKYKHLNA
ncbi:MAG: sulfoacetaldehyde acetyltransferase [Desulfobacula sp.]|uniref:sulfoacetaldehyde acetyltransferase n=1 Tax=Desulfobacula sp. TaxID=2593537 RepID=UPI0025C3463B|nr:sulfoacetaldehyde acetyltransferase [Desulfobacula sp.]MCD4720679.1 sulfoacetaldehyde acetyltransferase [Desulfobacula sp.]